jgi:hypothetical protein
MDSEIKTQNTAVTVIDGFASQNPTASPIRGPNARFKDGAYFNFSDHLDVRGKSYIVLDRLEGWQKLAKDCPPEYLIRTPGEPRPAQPHVDEKDWPLNLNGVPEHPWKYTYYLHLLDAATGEILTFSSATTGGRIAVSALSDQVAFMRRAKPDAVPVIALESREMPTQYGGTKPRPHFQILGWNTHSSLASQNLLTGPAQKVAEQPISEPTIAELLNDDLPEDLQPPKASSAKHGGPRGHCNKKR